MLVNLFLGNLHVCQSTLVHSKKNSTLELFVDILLYLERNSSAS